MFSFEKIFLWMFNSKYKLLSLLFVLSLIIFSCHNRSGKANRVIVVQPLDDFSPSQTKAVYNRIKQINPNTILKIAIPLPVTAYYTPRNRYRADSIIRYLKQFGNADTVVIGLTNKDISTTKGNIKDWGIMGLAFRPGSAGVVSTFRLSDANLSSQFYKVAIHELGHTQGLPHCSKKSCFMRDAEGGNPLNEEKDFCSSCKKFLKSKGWHLN